MKKSAELNVLTRGQKAWVTRRANLKAGKQVQAKKDAWATRRAKYGATGMSKNILQTKKQKGFSLEFNGIPVFSEEGFIGKVAMGVNGIHITK